jgi:hypothetical protein
MVVFCPALGKVYLSWKKANTMHSWIIGVEMDILSEHNMEGAPTILLPINSNEDFLHQLKVLET